jgi:hypothetical protein
LHHAFRHVPQRSSCVLTLTWCALQVPSQLFSLPLLMCDPFRMFAHRAFCARLIRLRADADNVRCPFEPELPKSRECGSKLLDFLLCPVQFFLQMIDRSRQISH